VIFKKDKKKRKERINCGRRQGKERENHRSVKREERRYLWRAINLFSLFSLSPSLLFFCFPFF